MCGLEDDNIVIVFLPLVMIVASRKQVSLLILGAGLVMKCEVIFSKFSHPARLLLVQLLWESEILEVLMIHPDFYVFGGAYEVMVPFGEREHDSK